MFITRATPSLQTKNIKLSLRLRLIFRYTTLVPLVWYIVLPHTYALCNYILYTSCGGYHSVILWVILAISIILSHFYRIIKPFPSIYQTLFLCHQTIYSFYQTLARIITQFFLAYNHYIKYRYIIREWCDNNLVLTPATPSFQIK